MSDSGTPEAVALAIANRIWQAEKGGSAGTFAQGDRAKFLELYAECLRTVRRPERA